MEKIGSLKARGDGKVHLFEVFRCHGYTVKLDGAQLQSGMTHSGAFSLIEKLCRENQWTR